jgi:hypothetical protein
VLAGTIADLSEGGLIQRYEVYVDVVRPVASSSR